MVENVVQIKIGIMINADVSTKFEKIPRVCMFGILVHILMKMVNI